MTYSIFKVFSHNTDSVNSISYSTIGYWVLFDNEVVYLSKEGRFSVVEPPFIDPVLLAIEQGLNCIYITKDDINKFYINKIENLINKRKNIRLLKERINSLEINSFKLTSPN